MLAKKFKRKLPRNYAFIFEDPKDVNEFYSFINTKYRQDHVNVGWNVPFKIEDQEFFLSYYETEIPNKTINLVPILIDFTLEEEGVGPVFNEGAYYKRNGNWYVAITIFDGNMKDCLRPNNLYRKKIINYLKDLQNVYLQTDNYEVLHFEKQ